MSSPHPWLRIHAEHQRDAYIVQMVGELDLSGCPDLEGALDAAEQAHAGRIIIDLEQLTFIDSIGLRTLLQVSRRSATNGNRLQITRGNGHPAKMFRLTGLDELLPLTDPCLCPTIQEAGDAPGARSHGKVTAAIAAARSMPDDSNRPRTGEDVIVGPTAWR